jgi:histidyl-tRNA synthetase
MPARCFATSGRKKGRYRQFHQIGAELIGPAEPLADAEIIALGWDILQALGVAEGVILELNTLGDAGKPHRLSRRAGGAFHGAPISAFAR